MLPLTRPSAAKPSASKTASAVVVPPGTLSPSQHKRVASGWHGEWRFSSLVASQPIGVAMPQKLNPGPLASKITFFAPVGLLFFFFVFF